MTIPSVSILIPAHNAEKWIGDTISSAVAQTWTPKEIIVVDDGSTDQTLAIAKQYESADVCVVQQSNQGAAAARNKAFSLCRGAYIQWLDADDLLGPDKIAQQMTALQTGGSARTLLSSSWGQFMYRPSRAQFIPSELWCDLPPAEFLLRKMLHKASMQTATWLVSRQLTEAAGPWDSTLAHDDDGEYFCRVLLGADGIRFARDAQVFYRLVGRNSVSYAGRSSRKLEALWRSMQLHIKYLRSLDDSQRARAACIKYLQNYLIDFSPYRPDLADELRRMAEQLGGRLELPRLSWKYSWLEPVLGWEGAASAQLFLPTLKWSMLRFWDKAAFGLERRTLATRLTA
jgi:glycosyltransferase involved in cell wall biosynthesis